MRLAFEIRPEEQKHVTPSGDGDGKPTHAFPSRAAEPRARNARAARRFRALLVAAAVAAGTGRAGGLAASQAEAPTPAADLEAVEVDQLAEARGAREAQDVAGVRGAELPLVAVPHGPEPIDRRNLWVPLLEVGVAAAGLNFVDREVLRFEWARSSSRTFWQNLGEWRFDDDPFIMNNLLHPFTGSIYYGAARSMGLDLWRSFGVAFLGSALWETGGETQAASINDQIMTPAAGSFLGEVLYRTAVLLLVGGDGAPGFWREGAAFLLSPPTGVNRRLFGDRYRSFDFEQRPVTYLEAFAGAAFDHASALQGGATAPGALLGLHLVYGLPEAGGWPVRHPFDHFDVQCSLRIPERESPSGALFIRGMLIGSRIEEAWRGVWGLAGIFDYAAPSVFHLSTAALGVSTTGQLGDRGGVVFQGTALLGAGFGSGDAMAGPTVGLDKHHGAAAQIVLETRLLLGDRAVVGAGLRQYLIAGAESGSGLEASSHLTLSGRLRLGGRHAVGIEWLEAQRWSRFAGGPDSRQHSSGLSISYVLTTDRWFGAARR